MSFGGEWGRERGSGEGKRKGEEGEGKWEGDEGTRTILWSLSCEDKGHGGVVNHY